jgi:hypothetical protein
MKTLVTQIEGKRKAEKKLPSWFQTPGILYPPSISMEQCSSEPTACYKSLLCSGNRLLDLTGGFGVDAWAFSKQIKEVSYCEQQQELVEIVENNFSLLGRKNITVHCNDAVSFLKKYNQKFDWIYIDPARRDTHHRRTFLLTDSTPNVILLLPELLQYTDRLMIKTSPLLDIDHAISDLKNVSAVHIIAVKNEVKELLLLMDKNNDKNIKIFTVNLLNDGSAQSLSFFKESVKNADAVFSMPKSFLYEPNAAIMKSGAFNLITNIFPVEKLHKNTHLYTSEIYQDNFSGKIFHILDVLPYKPIKTIDKANIVVRNFPDTPALIQKKLRINDGGKLFLFFTTLLNNKPSILVCEKVENINKNEI